MAYGQNLTKLNPFFIESHLSSVFRGEELMKYVQVFTKFDLKYVDSDGSKKTPVVLHRAIFGTFDRFTAFIIEETKEVIEKPLDLEVKSENMETYL